MLWALWLWVSLVRWQLIHRPHLRPLIGYRNENRNNNRWSHCGWEHRLQTISQQHCFSFRAITSGWRHISSSWRYRHWSKYDKVSSVSILNRSTTQPSPLHRLRWQHFFNTISSVQLDDVTCRRDEKIITKNVFEMETMTTRDEWKKMLFIVMFLNSSREFVWTINLERIKKAIIHQRTARCAVRCGMVCCVLGENCVRSLWRIHLIACFNRVWAE